MPSVLSTQAPSTKARHPIAIVVLISTMPPDELSPQALACGAEEILWKSDLRPALLDAIWLRNRPPPIP